LGETSLTYKERERETIRRLREELKARNVPAPAGPFDKADHPEEINLEELAEVIYEIQT